MIAQVLRNMSLFIDGRGYAGKVEEITLPKLTMKTNEFRPAGFDAPIEIETGMEKMEVSFTLAEYAPDMLKLFGLTMGGATKATLRGAARDGVGIPSAIEIAVRGKIKELDGGTWKAGDKASLKCAMALNYYRYKNNNETLIEIDVENMVRVIGGVDQLAIERVALGL